MDYPILKINSGEQYNNEIYYIDNLETINCDKFEVSDIIVCLVLPLLTRNEPRWIGLSKQLCIGTVVSEHTIIYATPFPDNFTYKDGLSQEMFDEINSEFFKHIDNAS